MSEPLTTNVIANVLEVLESQERLGHEMTLVPTSVLRLLTDAARAGTVDVADVKEQAVRSSGGALVTVEERLEPLTAEERAAIPEMLPWSPPYLWRLVRRLLVTYDDAARAGTVDAARSLERQKAERDFMTRLACIIEAAGGEVRLRRRALLDDPPDLFVSYDQTNPLSDTLVYTTRRRSIASSIASSDVGESGSE